METFIFLTIDLDRQRILGLNKDYWGVNSVWIFFLESLSKKLVFLRVLVRLELSSLEWRLIWGVPLIILLSFYWFHFWVAIFWVFYCSKTSLGLWWTSLKTSFYHYLSNLGSKVKSILSLLLLISETLCFDWKKGLLDHNWTILWVW